MTTVIQSFKLNIQKVNEVNASYFSHICCFSCVKADVSVIKRRLAPESAP